MGEIETGMGICEKAIRHRKLTQSDVFLFPLLSSFIALRTTFRPPSLPHLTAHSVTHLSGNTITPELRTSSEPPDLNISPHSFWPSLSSLNKQSLARLRRCLLDPEITLATDYPRYTEDEPHVPLNLTDVQDEVGVDTRPCSLTSTKVILGNWWVRVRGTGCLSGSTPGEGADANGSRHVRWYFTMAYGDWSQSPGECECPMTVVSARKIADFSC
jgi:hypothetical protein